MAVRKRRLILAPDARIDLGEILLESQQRWGKEQRAAYKSLVDRSLRLLVRFPSVGHARDEISPGLRSHPVGS